MILEILAAEAEIVMIQQWTRSDGPARMPRNN